MNFIKKLFGSNQIQSTKYNSGAEVNAVGFIYGTAVFSHGWNDPSELIPNETALILDLVESKSDIENRLNYWNKIYYNQITQHYSLNEKQLESISSIINVPKEKYRELYAHWPQSINEQTYQELLSQLKLKFVQFRPITEELKGKYVIKINEKFWNIKTHNSIVLVNIINTYERKIQDFELIHDTYQKAMTYGVIIMNRLCTERPPDSLYYYEQEIKKNIKSHQGLNSYDFDNYKDTKGEYNRIINEMGNDVLETVSQIESLENKPFEVIKISDDD
ncbi:hypothetical protein SAMN05421823_108308 [Catalinimonas alkaloidigena]|uniref:Uncharacterized protein n=1 Tax=Catalinimonas alkaloidigena TaxID=1075417 RepID=A0A1G9NIZ4_9BACT|nr:hypothetical protein [Catalinimonas alkaloidigena]SDL86334.1 hypothetical protein SAMN05421823_108308 [Catalinimonas alkaloidigena]